MVSGRALTIAHQRPSVTTPIGTPAARSSSSIRSIGLAAQPSSSGSRSESTGSMTRTSAPVSVAVRRARPSARDGDRVVGRADLDAGRAPGSVGVLPADDVAQDRRPPTRRAPRGTRSSAAASSRSRVPALPGLLERRLGVTQRVELALGPGGGMPCGQTRLQRRDGQERAVGVDQLEPGPVQVRADGGVARRARLIGLDPPGLRRPPGSARTRRRPR